MAGSAWGLAVHGSDESVNDARRRLASDPLTPHFVFVESRPAVAEALCHSFEQLNIGTATSASTTKALIESGTLEDADVVVLDVGTADHEAFGPAESLLRTAPHLRLVAASSSGKVANVPMLKRAGFHGFVEREASLTEFAEVVVTVAKGRLAFPDAKAPTVGTRTPEEQALLLARHLTAREHQILVMLVRGSSSTEIGEQLKIRGTTVRTHIQNIMVKLQVHTRLQAVMFAVRHGLVSVDGDDYPEPSDEEFGEETG